MVSICMAVRNGALFIQEQIDSILPQLALNDELIVSNDHSDDSTLEIIKAYHDSRIKIINNKGSGVINNFENALLHAAGDHIFLADQDDIWHSHKVHSMCQFLDSYDVVVCDCSIVDINLKPESISFFQINKSKKGLLRNIVQNSYVGCCMAFKRVVLDKILPFPRNIPMHDIWIGLVAELHYSVFFLPEQLVLHRRHSNNASSTSQRSSQTLLKKVSGRIGLIGNLLRIKYA
jgi:glycosyltransferase involved in cell wall biosynthesis